MEEYRVEIEVTVEQLRDIFGQYDSHIGKLEKQLHVSVVNRNDALQIYGEKEEVDEAKRIIIDLLQLSERGSEIDEQRIDYAIQLSKDQEDMSILERDKELICHTTRGKPIKPKTIGQKKYIDAIKNKMIVFGIGPAGTGKTYLAMAMAITAFKNNEVQKIILTRPAIEAGEKLGFLPGDLQSKIDPYLRPLYDALYEIMGAESFIKKMEKVLLKFQPLAYMRGRTLDDAFIILDEAQNTTPAQMKMFLTRIGFGSKVIITGDATQIDLEKGIQSGLDVAQKILNKIEDISFIKLSSKDVVRHPLVQKIVKAYETYETKNTNRMLNKGNK